MRDEERVIFYYADVNVALPVLAVEFDISDSYAVWIITVYQLIITMLLLPLSSAGDLYSYRKTFLTGVGVFTCASLLCAVSQNFTMIIISRAVQGIGAACVMSVNIDLTRLIYPKEVLGRGLALNAMVIAIATAAGPTIAGAILSVTAAPTRRTGGAGGMQSTARLMGQTLGATLVTVVFALTPDMLHSVETCLWIAAGVGLTAGIFSISRATRPKVAR